MSAEPTYRMPYWMRAQAGERLKGWEWVFCCAERIASALKIFRWRIRMTPELRERCVNYAIQSGPSSSSIESRADELAEYIARGAKWR